MPVNPAYRKAKYDFVAGRPIYEPSANEIAQRAAECRESWTEADYHERAGLPYGEPLEADVLGTCNRGRRAVLVIL